ncbi:hypothetical protein GCM10009525_34930 [Streptosporangium amethystogenes subsp. fukuiense]
MALREQALSEGEKRLEIPLRADGYYEDTHRVKAGQSRVGSAAVGVGFTLDCLPGSAAEVTCATDPSSDLVFLSGTSWCDRFPEIIRITAPMRVLAAAPGSGTPSLVAGGLLVPRRRSVMAGRRRPPATSGGT